MSIIFPNEYSILKNAEVRSFATLAMVQEIPHKPISQVNDKTESCSAASQRFLLAHEIAPSYRGPSSMITAADTDFSLTIPKVDGPDLRNFSEKRSSNEEIKEDEQERKSGTNAISAWITQSGSLLLVDEEESQTAINADCSDGESTKDDKHDNSGKENPELDAASNESNHGNQMQFNKETPKSNKKCIIVNNDAELGGHGVWQHNDMGAMDIKTNDNDNNIKRDKGSLQLCVAPREISVGTILSCTTHPIDVKNNDTIPIPAENDIIETQQLISNEERRICQLPSTSGPALCTINRKSSGVKFHVDLNAPHDAASVDVCSSQGGASIDVNESSQTSHIDLNMADPALTDNASDGRGPANSNLGTKVDMTHDFTHAQNYLQSQTKITEMTKGSIDQPGCLVLFGKVIFQAPPSEIKHTSMQDNQIHGCSRSITANMTVPSMDRDDRSYPSGPWSTWTGAPIDSYHQSVFSNQMPHDSVKGNAAGSFQSRRSAFVNWRQMPHLNMTPHGMPRDGEACHMGPESRSRSLNSDPCLLDTSRPQAPGPVTPSTTNGEGSSRSNTRCCYLYLIKSLSFLSQCTTSSAIISISEMERKRLDSSR